MRRPLARDLVGVGADVEGEQAVTPQCAPYRVDGGMSGEGLGGDGRGGGAQRRLEAAAMLGQHLSGPAAHGVRQRHEPRQRGIEIARHLVDELDRGRDVHRLDVDLQQRPIVDPGLVLDLDCVIADPDDQIGGAKELALDLAAGPLDAAECERMVLVDHALGHGRGGERQMVAFDELAQQLRIADAHRCQAEHRERPPGACDQLSRPSDGRIGRGGEPCRARRRGHRFVGGRERHVLGQIEMHRPSGSLSASAIACVSISVTRVGSILSVALVIGLNSAWWSIHIWMRRPSWSQLRL